MSSWDILLLKRSRVFISVNACLKCHREATPVWNVRFHFFKRLSEMLFWDCRNLWNRCSLHGTLFCTDDCAWMVDCTEAPSLGLSSRLGNDDDFAVFVWSCRQCSQAISIVVWRIDIGKKGRILSFLWETEESTRGDWLSQKKEDRKGGYCHSGERSKKGKQETVVLMLVKFCWNRVTPLRMVLLCTWAVKLRVS